MTAPIQTIADRIIGAVEEVTADRILVRLDPDAPQATALNTGAPAGFPRINGYVLIPNEGGSTACIISSVRIDRMSFPKRMGMQKDFGLVDLPFPSRVMSLTSLTPIGMPAPRATNRPAVSTGAEPAPRPEGRLPLEERPTSSGNTAEHANPDESEPPEDSVTPIEKVSDPRPLAPRRGYGRASPASNTTPFSACRADHRMVCGARLPAAKSRST